MENLTPFLALSFLITLIAFGFAAYLYLWVKKQPTVNETIRDVSGLIKEGANTFMTREYKILAMFALGLAALIFVLLPAPLWSDKLVISRNLFSGRRDFHQDRRRFCGYYREG